MRVRRDSPLAGSPIIPIHLADMKLKSQLKFYLSLREMSASQLARKAQVPKQSLSGWLGGSNPRDVKQVKRVADALGVSVDNLLFGEGRDETADRVTQLDALMGDGWVSGIFEVRLRRISRKKEEK